MLNHLVLYFELLSKRLEAFLMLASEQLHQEKENFDQYHAMCEYRLTRVKILHFKVNELFLVQDWERLVDQVDHLLAGVGINEDAARF